MTIRIGVDAMGGDLWPEVMVPAAMNFAQKHRDIDVVIYGIRSQIDRYVHHDDWLEIVDCLDMIEADFKPEGRSWITERKDTSLLRMIQDLKNGEIEWMLTAGNTPGCVSAAFTQIGRIHSNARFAFASEFPNALKPISLGLDMGANPDISPEHIAQYALLWNIYQELRYGNQIPVWQINIGTEAWKWMELHREADKLLRDISRTWEIDYLGNVEPYGLLSWDKKIVVGGAYDMNIALKGIKAGADYTLSKIPFWELLRKRTNKSAGAVLLWAKKPIAKANGNSDIGIIYRTLQELIHYIQSLQIDELQERYEQSYGRVKNRLKK